MEAWSPVGSNKCSYSSNDLPLFGKAAVDCRRKCGGLLALLSCQEGNSTAGRGGLRLAGASAMGSAPGADVTVRKQHAYGAGAPE